MNLTIFCNINRFAIRSINTCNLQKFASNIRNYELKPPFWISGKHWTIRSTATPLMQKIQNVREVATTSMTAAPPNENQLWSFDAEEEQQQHKNDDDDERRKGGRATQIGTGLAGVSAAFTFNFFRKNKDDDLEESPEDKMITTIKRGILSIQRRQYDKAESILHMALRMAQDLNHEYGVTYVFDLMANLAMEREQYKKAEKLFTDVMKRLFKEGKNEIHPQVLHISAKLAHMAQLQGDFEKARQGFTWTIGKIEEALKKSPDDKDIRELWGLTTNWYGQLQMKLGKFSDAKRSFQAAYECFVQLYGKVNQEAVTILNNLSVACANVDDYDEAKRYLHEALDVARQLKDTMQEGILQANLGLILLRQGLLDEARATCALAYRIGKNSNSDDAIEQAEYCLNEIKTSLD